jgi:hypothetical protein
MLLPVEWDRKNTVGAKPTRFPVKQVGPLGRFFNREIELF